MRSTSSNKAESRLRREAFSSWHGHHEAGCRHGHRLWSRRWASGFRIGLGKADRGTIGHPRHPDRFDVSDLPAKIAGQVPRGEPPRAPFADDWVPPKDQRKMDEFIVYALAAAEQAVEDAGWKPQDEESANAPA
jgi:3-oxoacyl-(acyl-carrier-protein) synthase